MSKEPFIELGRAIAFVEAGSRSFRAVEQHQGWDNSGMAAECSRLIGRAEEVSARFSPGEDFDVRDALVATGQLVSLAGLIHAKIKPLEEHWKGKSGTIGNHLFDAALCFKSAAELGGEA